MTTPTQQELIDALQLARRRIGKGYVYVCHALPKSKSGDYLRGVIESRIFPFSSVRSWLARNVPGKKLYPIEASGRLDLLMREYRLRWIDSLIEEVGAGKIGGKP